MSPTNAVNAKEKAMSIHDKRTAILSAIMTLLDRGIPNNAPVVNGLEDLLNAVNQEAL